MFFCFSIGLEMLKPQLLAVGIILNAPFLPGPAAHAVFVACRHGECWKELCLLRLCGMRVVVIPCVLGSKLPLFPSVIGDSHQANSRGLYTRFLRISVIKGGMSLSPNIGS